MANRFADAVRSCILKGGRDLAFERQVTVKVHRSIPVLGALAALTLGLAASPTSAHHSAAPFEMTKNITVSGTVERWVWSNPHCWLYIRAVKADGTQQIWGFEAGSSGMLARNGWNSADMKPGDKVSVTAHPSRDGRTVGLISTVKLANGKVLGDGAPLPPR
jgi:hypothetical protein